MEFKLNNDLWRHNEVWQINRNHWLEIFRGGFWSHFFFQGGLCPPDFFSAYSTDQNEPLWRKKSAPLKKKKRPSEEKKAPPWKVSPLINLPLLLKNVTGTQCGKGQLGVWVSGQVVFTRPAALAGNKNVADETISDLWTLQHTLSSLSSNWKVNESGLLCRRYFTYFVWDWWPDLEKEDE